jgi:hypothetical protein
MAPIWSYLAAELRHRWHAVRATKDGGYSTEAVVVTAVLATGALIVFGIIIAKLVAKANGINLG